MLDQKQDTLPTPKTKKPKAKKTKAKSNKGTLTLKQIAFIDAYFANALNATMAYMELYPNSAYNAARSSSSTLLTNPNIKAEIDRRFSEQVMSPSEVLKRLSDMSRASLLPFIRITNEGFTYFDFSHPEAKNYFHLIKKLKTKRTRRVDGHGEDAELWEDEWIEVELYDAQAALEKVGKVHNLFIDRTDFTSDGEKVNVMVYMPDNGRDK
jgi:hypothetical protein